MVAIAVSLTISTRLKTAEHNGLRDYIRTLILLTLLCASIPLATYSLAFYLPSVSGLVTHWLEELPALI